jgi:hypothetical protein
VTSHETKRTFWRTKDIEQRQEKKKELLSTLLVIEDMERVPKRLKTEDEPVVAAVKVKVESDNNKEEEDKEDEGQVAHAASSASWTAPVCTTKTKVHPGGLPRQYGGWSDSRQQSA